MFLGYLVKIPLPQILTISANFLEAQLLCNKVGVTHSHNVMFRSLQKWQHYWASLVRLALFLSKSEFWIKSTVSEQNQNINKIFVLYNIITNILNHYLLMIFLWIIFKHEIKVFVKCDNWFKNKWI